MQRIAALTLAAIFSVGGVGALGSTGEQVYVIADVLVVVRSELEIPLTGFYESVGELKRDAEMQLNISGSNYVVYIFGLDDDLRPTELKRIAYPAND